MAMLLQQVPAFDALVLTTTVVYSVAFALVLVWTGWSVRKHGWCRRSLRRFSYLLFLLLLATRILWCSTLLLALRDAPFLPNRTLLLMPLALAFDYASFVLHFLAFSMLVSGWADSTHMIMSGRSLQPAATRRQRIIGPSFLVVNVLNTAAALVTLAPVLIWPSALGGGGSGPWAGAGIDADSVSVWTGGAEALVGFALYLSALSRGGMSLLLALSSSAFGLLVSLRIHNIARIEPNLKSASTEKVLKVLLAAVVFTSMALARAYVLLHDVMQPDEPPLTAADYVCVGVLGPDLLPILAALLVLRRRPLCGAAGWSEEAEATLVAPCCGRRGGGCACCCCCCIGGDDRYAVKGVDPAPLVIPIRGR